MYKTETRGIDKIYALMKEEIDKNNIQGVSVLLREGGEERVFLACGMADREEGIPVRRDTIFRLYSLTKPVIGAAIMKLVEKGLLDLGENVSVYLPGFRNQKVLENEGLVPVKREAAIIDLLSMTAGLPSPGDRSSAGGRMTDIFRELEERRGTQREMTIIEFANRAGQCPLINHPGQAYHYSVCADILGAVIEIVSGQSLWEFLEKEITGPLNMHDTGFWVPAEKRHRLAKMYEAVEDDLKPYKDNFLGILNAMDRQPVFASGGAGLVSTLDDYSRFAQMLLNDGELDGVRILRQETVHYFITGRLSRKVQETFYTEWPLLSGFSYGNLLRVYNQQDQAVTLASPGEYGWDGWTGMYFENFPEKKMTLLVGMQRINSGIIPFTRKLRNVVLSN